MTSSSVIAAPPESNASGREAINWLAPRSFEAAEQIAGLMAKMGTMPSHLVGKPADCFRIVIQAAKFGMDPFAVAECTSLVHGRLCYEGKLVAAMLEQTGAIEGHLRYKITGKGQDSSIVVSGTRRGETEVLTCEGTVAGWRTVTKSKDGNGTIPNNWDKNPHDMLIYRGTRQWARLHCPGPLLGVTTPDEIDNEPRDVTASATVRTEVPEVKDAKVREVPAVPPVVTEVTSKADPIGSTVVNQAPTQPVETQPLFTLDELTSLLNKLVTDYPTSGMGQVKALMASLGVKTAKELPADKIAMAIKQVPIMRKELELAAKESNRA